MLLSPSQQLVMPTHGMPGPASDRHIETPLRLRKIVEHSRRCRAVKRPDRTKVARIVAAYLADGRRARQGRSAFALPTQNGADCDADRRVG